MRKIFLPLLICALTANTAEATIRWTTGRNTECFRSIDGAKQSTVQYYFCGHQEKSCYGLRWISTHKTPQWMVEGDGKYVEKDGAKWWCCGGTGGEDDGTTGTFKSGAQWSTTENVTIEVGDGTCTYQKKTTVCGTVVSDNKCTVPDTCPPGKVLRNRKCAVTCLKIQGYESATSNKCVKCTGDDRGVDSTGVCVVCKSGQKWNGKVCEDADTTPSAPDETPSAPDEVPSAPDETPSAGCKSTEYISPVSGKCVNKSKSAQYSRDMMYECYGCSTDVRFKNCLNIYSAAPKALTSTQKGTLKACNITEDQYTEAVGGVVKKTPMFVKLNLNSDVIRKKFADTPVKLDNAELTSSSQQQSVADAIKDATLPTGLTVPKQKFDSITAASQMTMM